MYELNELYQGINTESNPSKVKRFNEMKAILDYIDIIKNSDEIYLIDSCFLGIVLPFLKTNRLKTIKVEIVLRNKTDEYVL
jgi:hypothetical protein